MNRNTFLRTLASSLPLFNIQKAFSANSQLQIAAIGVGGKGGSDLQHLSRHGKLIAACDISSKKLAYALKGKPDVSRFSDYREMLSHMGGKIDVLSISSPDHTHAHAAQLAIKRGIHVFIQSPAVHTIWEGRQILNGITKNGIVSQLGLQGCASDRFRSAIEFLRTDALGEIQEVHVWTNRPIWKQAPNLLARPMEDLPVPNGLNWDAFLGPAMERPYHKIYQPYHWRGWRSFGSGALGDTGLHLLNLPVMGLGLLAPLRVECLTTGPVNPETFSAWGVVKYKFSYKDGAGELPLLWYEGKIGHLNEAQNGKPNIPPIDLFKGRNPSANGCLILGSKGTFYSSSIYGSDWQVSFGSKWLLPNELELPPASLPRNGRGDAGMKDELIQSIRNGTPSSPFANLSYGVKLNEIAILGNISLLAGGKFNWDSEGCESDRSDINGLLSKPYRNGWAVEKSL